MQAEEENSAESVDKKIKQFLDRTAKKAVDPPPKPKPPSEEEIRQKTAQVQAKVDPQKNDPFMEKRLMRLKAIADSFLLFSYPEQKTRFELLDAKDRMTLVKMLPDAIRIQLEKDHPEIRNYKNQFEKKEDLNG